SNLARLVDLYGGKMDETGKITQEADLELMRKELFSVSITDEQTRNMIGEAFKNYGLLLEPHGSVAWAGLMEYLKSYSADCGPDQLCISLETAHPAKFPDEIRKILNVEPDLPASLKGIDDLPEHVGPLKNDYPSFKEYLLKNYQ
ncbi:MAG TPA: hypothetical protein VMC08_01740, partial [Bacteroidales bacterium]|nr:hypothetical protein [Bacteroidales bacterium]